MKMGSLVNCHAIPNCSKANKRGGEWSFKSHVSTKIHRCRTLVFFAVMCVSQSRFFSRLTKSRNIDLFICLFFSYYLKVAQNSFQHLDFDGSLLPSLSLDATIMVSKNAQSLVNTLLSFS